MVECDLAKVEVAGSNPVSRSKTSAVPLMAILTIFSERISGLAPVARPAEESAGS